MYYRKALICRLSYAVTVEEWMEALVRGPVYLHLQNKIQHNLLLNLKISQKPTPTPENTSLRNFLGKKTLFSNSLGSKEGLSVETKCLSKIVSILYKPATRSDTLCIYHKET